MPVFFSIAGVVLGIFILIQAGKRVVSSLAAMARFLGISEFVLSFLLVAFATSLPELTVGINSALLGISELSFGDILGTNIINFTLILGTIAVVGKGIALKDYKHFKKNRFFEFALLLAPLLLMLDGVLSRLDGLMLFALFMWNVIRLLDIDDILLGKKILRPHLMEHVHHKADSWKEFFKNFGIFVVSVTALLTSAIIIVYGIRNISEVFNISKVFIGVLVIGIGTSLPELTIGIRSVRTNKDGVSLGDIFGSAVINSNLVLGSVAIISPIVLHDKTTLWNGLIFTVIAFATALLFLRGGKNSISRKEGMFLIAIYVLFAAVEIFTHLY